jgi:uncharacterized tellurite resistance protein B-like protein
MPIRRLLKSLGLHTDEPDVPRDAFLARVHQHLKQLGTNRVEYLAAFAGQLARVAYADDGISEAEAASMANLLETRANLPAHEARLVADIAGHEFEALREVGEHLLNRTINEHASALEKEQLVDCLFAVAAADHLVSDAEETEIRRVASNLLLPHKTLMDIRLRYKDQLEVLQFAKKTARGPAS